MAEVEVPRLMLVLPLLCGLWRHRCDGPALGHGPARKVPWVAKEDVVNVHG